MVNVFGSPHGAASGISWLLFQVGSVRERLPVWPANTYRRVTRRFLHEPPTSKVGGWNVCPRRASAAPS